MPNPATTFNPSSTMVISSPANLGSDFSLTNGVWENKAGLKHRVFDFSAGVNQSDTWASGIKQIVALAWQAYSSGPNVHDEASAFVSTPSNGTITFREPGTGAAAGYLHVWSRD